MSLVLNLFLEVFYWLIYCKSKSIISDSQIIFKVICFFNNSCVTPFLIFRKVLFPPWQCYDNLDNIPKCANLSAKMIYRVRHKNVNIFHKNISCVIVLLSTCCKTYCFAFQKRRFCTVKAALLQRKTYAFAMPNRNCHFLKK